jgi:uncharacterized protein (DUF2132 family)
MPDRMGGFCCFWVSGCKKATHDVARMAERSILTPAYMLTLAFNPLDPLHGVNLKSIVEDLVDTHGWEVMAERIPIRCFMFEPSVTSSLKFLRKTPWARKKVEDWYISGRKTKVHTTNFRNTFVTVSPDCATPVSEVPPDSDAVAAQQHALLSAHPYEFTSDELFFQLHAQQLGLNDAELAAQHEALWAAFFAKPVAGLRASALPKIYGWGFHIDNVGRVALVAQGSPEYKRMGKSNRLTQIAGMRNKRSA